MANDINKRQFRIVNKNRGKLDITKDNLHEVTGKNNGTEGVTNWKQLNDTPSVIQPLKTVRGDSTGSYLEFWDAEAAFSKNTAFNKNFGTTGGTVVEGNDTRVLNGQTAFSWGDHSTFGYLTSFIEINDLTNAVVWANVPDINITESSVVQHEAALTITESQISDLTHFVPTSIAVDYGFAETDLLYEPLFSKNTAFNKNFGTTVGTVAEGNDSRINNGQTAFGWGNHALVGYLTSFTEADPVFIASQAFNIDSTDITNLSNLSGVNTGDQDLSPYMLLSQKGAAFGVAELDENGILLSSQMPSYVDDVLEFNTIGDLPTTGESGKIYITTDTNKTYRWGGTTYVPIGSDIVLGETSSTAYRGDRGKVAYDHSQIISGNPHGTTFAQLNSKPTTIGGYGITDFNTLGDARYVLKNQSDATTEGTLTIGGLINIKNNGAFPYIGFDGSQGVSRNLLNSGVELRWYYDGFGQPFGKIWHSMNDGSGSGLDADLLDGVEGGSYLRSNTETNKTTGNLIFNEGTSAAFGAATRSRITNGGGETLWILNEGDLIFRDGSTPRFTFGRTTGDFTATGAVTANSFIKSGGTSSQFLKANGSVDTNSYALSTHTHTFASLTSKPTTISGYGITDFNSLGDARWLRLTGGTLTGTVTATNFILTTSDERFKTKISNYVPKEIGLNLKNYVLKSDEEEKQQLGVIAQELELTHPEFVRTNDEGFKAVDYTQLLLAKIAELEDRLKKAGI